MHSGELQWITVVSRQAVLMSLCLQSMVEELLRERDGEPVRRARYDSGPGDASSSSGMVDYPYPRRDGTVSHVPVRPAAVALQSHVSSKSQKVKHIRIYIQHTFRIPPNFPPSGQIDPAALSSSLSGRQYSVKRLSERFAAVRFRDAARAAEDVLFENGAFRSGKWYPIKTNVTNKYCFKKIKYIYRGSEQERGGVRANVHRFRRCGRRLGRSSAQMNKLIKLQNLKQKSEITKVKIEDAVEDRSRETNLFFSLYTTTYVQRTCYTLKACRFGILEQN